MLGGETCLTVTPLCPVTDGEVQTPAMPRKPSCPADAHGACVGCVRGLWEPRSCPGLGVMKGDSVTHRSQEMFWVGWGGAHRVAVPRVGSSCTAWLGCEVSRAAGTLGCPPACLLCRGRGGGGYSLSGSGRAGSSCSPMLGLVMGLSKLVASDVASVAWMCWEEG